MKKCFSSFPVLGPALVVNLVLLSIAAEVAAQPSVVPSLTVNAPGLGIATTHAPASSAFQLAADGKSWELKPGGRFFIPGAPFAEVLDLRFDPDPLIYGNILVQNNTGSTQNYLFGFSIPTTFGAPSLIRGSIDTSIIGTAGQISTVAAFPIYSAQIDSVTIQTLQNSPFTLTTSQGAVSSSAQFGFNLNNIPVASSIGILLQFQLSPGDTAAIISDFEVVAVPEPATMTLVFVGACLLAYRRQRA
jgi:hypothetical protein